MTPANKTKCENLAKHFKTLAKENPGASASMYAMLKAQFLISAIQMDLHFRPEVNSE